MTNFRSQPPSRRVPLQAVGKPAAAAALEAGALDLLHDLRGRHLAQRLGKRLVAAVRDVVVDRLGVDLAAKREGAAELLAKERDVSLAAARALVRGVVEEQALDSRACEPGLEDLRGVLLLDPAVHHSERLGIFTSGPAAQKP